MDNDGEELDGGRAPMVRKHYTAFNGLRRTIHNTLFVQSRAHPGLSRNIIQPHMSHMRYVTSPYGNTQEPAEAICPHYVQYGQNRYKPKSPCLAGAWSSDGRRFVIGTQAGEFTIWESDIFKFERVITTHQDAIRALAWSKNGRIVISGDQTGVIKYFSPQITFVKALSNAHTSAVRGLSYSPTETKFVSCSDDKMVTVWDWERGEPEHQMEGHLNEVKCVQWHPTHSLVVSGAKDSTVRLFDPRQGEAVSVIHAHKNTVLCCDWNKNGNWLATGSRDFLIKLFDIRKMKEFSTLYGQNKEVCTVKWHPQQETLLASGGFNGALAYWVLGHNGPHTVVGRAHNYSVNVLEWHPLGHVLATAANDGINKFWCREPPGSMLINDASNPQFLESSTATEARDPLNTLYGPITPDLAATVLPDLSMQTNAGIDAIAGGLDSREGEAKGFRRPFVQYGGRGEQPQKMYNSGDQGGRGPYINSYSNNRQSYQPGNTDHFETASTGSGGSFGGRGGRGRGRGRTGGGRFAGGPQGFHGSSPPPPPPSAASYYGPSSGAVGQQNSRASNDFMSSFAGSSDGGSADGNPRKRSRFSNN